MEVTRIGMRVSSMMYLGAHSRMQVNLLVYNLRGAGSFSDDVMTLESIQFCQCGVVVY